MTAADAAGRLARLQRRHRACTRCQDAGFIPAARPVFEGRPGRRILLVGQAPGVVEHEVGRPFMGRAGRQLVRWMERAGFAGDDDLRARVYMTSVTTCFPGRRPDGTGDRRPGPAEVALCAPWLDGVLDVLAPRLVLAVGTLALARFLPRRTLDGTVGRVFGPGGEEVPNDPGFASPVIVALPHPSGQSRWLNDPARLERLETALARLRDLVPWAEGHDRAEMPGSGLL